jgi:nucleotide-binding universal stress UspA family protein
VTLLVGFAPDGRDRAVLRLASMLARSGGDDLVVCSVIPEAWPPSLARIDAEYQAYLEQLAQEALDDARARLPGDLPATFLIYRAHSTPGGLLEVAEARGARMIVAGSSVHAGSGFVSLGSATSRLVHSSPVTVALAPHQFRCAPDARVARVTAAFGGSDVEFVVAAASVAERVGASLRIASFAVRARPPYTSGVGRMADDAMDQEWIEQIRAATGAALDKVERLRRVPREIETVIGHGESWEEALDDVEWDGGDVLAVGSSTEGPLARVFLGSRAAKIVRHTPVPVVVIPRGRVEALAEEAMAEAAGQSPDPQ